PSSYLTQRGDREREGGHRAGEIELGVADFLLAEESIRVCARVCSSQIESSFIRRRRRRREDEFCLLYLCVVQHASSYKAYYHYR
ncbi:unnamed protein product, partial [Brassica oleracea]